MNVGRIRPAKSDRLACGLSPSTSFFETHFAPPRISWRKGMPKKSSKGARPLAPRGRTLRAQLWFDNPDNPGMTALYLERYLSCGLSGAELRSGKPLIGI